MSGDQGLDETFAPARAVADAVLYEGYLLYPYRASAGKNQLRWQFGVVAPQPYATSDGSEDWVMQTDCVVEPGPERPPERGAGPERPSERDAGPDTRLDVRVRCLRVQERRVEAAADPDGSAFDPVPSLDVDGSLVTSFDEATEEEIDVADVGLTDLVGGERQVVFELPLTQREELLRTADGRLAGRIIRRRQAVSGVLRLSAEAVTPFGHGAGAGPFPLARVRVRVENVTDWAQPGAPRDDVVRRSMVAVHTLLAVRSGSFVSLFDPPELAKAAVAGCENLHTFPVLIGDPGSHDVLLSSPVTLYDYADVAPESAGQFYDSTEIDEMLALRVMTLTDAEKREARGTDPRAAAIVDRCDIMPKEVFERLHGAVRYLRDVAAPVADDDFPTFTTPDDARLVATPDKPQSADGGQKPWWDPGVDGEVDPFEDRVWIGDAEVGPGSAVRLRPTQRADAHDMFLVGRSAHVHAVLHDVDGNTQLAVTVDDDPASDMHQWYGRYLYFNPSEVDLLDEAVT